ncbi:MAG: hypothetical protein GWN01_02375 [Nitrosopumilaceae archaeon]|nr:hypothetical protein [Nitrosopumilaceae archaeon]NIU86171.1 hypothetical protein [Nitrosopumilaceae archaeon]NIX60418.1 hypothetical protein [Nitrosopumilaceae archaeon]
MPKSSKSDDKSSETGFYQGLKKEIKDNLIKYIAATFILILSGVVATIWDVLDFTLYNKGSFEVIIKNERESRDFELRIYQDSYFIQNVATMNVYKFISGNYELKIKPGWSTKPIPLERFKVIKGRKTNIICEIPKPAVAHILGQVNLRGKSLEPGVNFTIEAYEQNRATLTNDDGHYFLEVLPDPCVRLYVEYNSKVVWTTAVFDVKSEEFKRNNITIPYERLH